MRARATRNGIRLKAYAGTRRETSVADTYVCEMMRLYDHYRFRFNRTSRAGRGPARRLMLTPNDSWTDRYFEPGSLLALERVRFNR